MKRAKVKSSNIISIGYDDDLEILEVAFKDGAVYQYDGVPKKLHLKLMKAKSPGKVLHAEIKGKFKSERSE